MDELKTINDMRAILAEQINKLRTGDTTPANVNAIVNASGKILTTVKMEIEYARLVGHTPHIDFIEQVKHGKQQKKLPTKEDIK